MKVKKIGIIPERVMELNCWYCSAELECDSADVIVNMETYEVKCPCCQKKILLNKDTMPRGMVLELGIVTIPEDTKENKYQQLIDLLSAE